MSMKMKKKPIGIRIHAVIMIFMVSVLMIQASGTVFAADYPKEVLDAKQTIKGRMMISHIDFLASKYCRGRETGDWGMDVAGKYITSVLSGIGATPAGDFGGFFQPVKLKNVHLDKNIQLKIESSSLGAKVVKNARIDWDYLPVIISAETAVSAPAVFAGYGITAPEHKYDDYKNINASGKIVLVMRHEPGENESSSPFEGEKNSKYGTLLVKILNAQKHGAAGIMFVTDPMNHDDLEHRGGSYMSGTYWPSLRKERMKKDEDFKYMKFEPRMRLIGADFGVRIPAVTISNELAGSLLGNNRSLLKIQEQIDKTMKPNSFSLNGKRVTMDIFFNNEPVEANNIVAKIEGSDPELKKEIVIVGGHYDHEGKDNRGRVYGGADDNASGTSAVIELARAFKQLETKPKRTILFILFTAEEKGLLGARYYTENPLYPLDKTIAMVNLDMLGRNDVAQIAVVGKYQFPKLFDIIAAANKKSVNFDLTLSAESFLANSDHFPFMRKDVPSIFFNSGSHDQLHRPEDTVRRINPDKMEKAGQLVFLALWDLANLPAGTRLK
jgi:hypothetical protein